MACASHRNKIVLGILLKEIEYLHIVGGKIEPARQTMPNRWPMPGRPWSQVVISSSKRRGRCVRRLRSLHIM